MRQWDLDLSIPEEDPLVTSTGFSVGWREEIAGIRFLHEVAFRTGAEVGREDVSRIVWRILCHILIGQIPDSGLRETGESLLRIRHFYQERLGSDLPLLAANSQIKAKWGRSYERPDFHVSEE
jgi:hypothetical protein